MIFHAVDKALVGTLAVAWDPLSTFSIDHRPVFHRPSAGPQTGRVPCAAPAQHLLAAPTIERKLCAMKGFHDPDGRQQAFLPGLAHLDNLVPYQRRAQHAGLCGVEVEGGTVPTRDWFLNLQILTSGGFQ